MKILIADDHRLVLEAVADKLTELGPDTCFVQAMSVHELLDSVSDELDLAIIDLGMPGAHGLNHVQEVRRLLPGLPVIVLSGQEDPLLMRAVLSAGARGFIPKAYSPDVMLSAVRLVLAGGEYVPPMMVAPSSASNPCVVCASMPSDAPAGRDDHGACARSLAQLRNLLTERQLEVLNLLSEGQPNKVIGRNLGISEGTVKIHLAAIFRALKVRNRTEAVVAVRELSEA